MGNEENYRLHPIILDTYSQLQSSIAQFSRSYANTQFIPVNIESLVLSQTPSARPAGYLTCATISTTPTGTHLQKYNASINQRQTDDVITGSLGMNGETLTNRIDWPTLTFTFWLLVHSI